MLALACVVGLLGADPARLVAWARGDAEDRIELARALSEADLMHLATATLTEALILNRSQPGSLGQALDLYPLSLRGDPPVPRVLVALADQPDADLSPGQRSLRAFLAGQALLAVGRPGDATAQLARVAPGSPAYAAARYLSGVAAVTPPFRDFSVAEAHFRAAVVEADAAPGAPPIVREAGRLALLGLGRISYELGRFEVALYYYRRLPPGSPEQVDAAFETAWAHVLRGDMQRALGAVHAARAPGVLHPARPELNLVAGAALLALCQYEPGRAELDRLENEYLSGLSVLQAQARYLDGRPGGEASRGLLEGASALPPRLRHLLAQQPGVRRARATQQAIEAERRRLGAIARERGLSLAALEPLGEGLTRAAAAAVDAAIRAAVRQMVGDWTRLRDARAELTIDILEAQSSALEAAIRSRRVDAPAPRQTRVAALGEDWQRWDFDGTFWPDEVGAYLSTLPAQCAAAEEEGAAP